MGSQSLQQCRQPSPPRRACSRPFQMCPKLPFLIKLELVKCLAAVINCLIFVTCCSFGMELSGIELRYLVNEIRSRVTSGYYASGVNAITKSSLLLKLHHPTHEDIMLVLSATGVWITKLKFKPVEENSLESVAQKELER